MLTIEEKGIAYKIIKKFFEHFDMINILSYDEYVPNVYGHVSELREYGTKINCRVDYGATKLVLIPDELQNWVIKIGYLQDTSCCFSEEYSIKNYCELEVEYYEKAVTVGCSHFLAATKFLMEINNISIYLQEKVMCDSSYYNSELSRAVSDSSDLSKEDFNDEDDYYDAIEDEKGDLTDSEKVVLLTGDYKLADFVSSNGINDLHGANWGIDLKTGEFRLIDYSGYND